MNILVWYWTFLFNGNFYITTNVYTYDLQEEEKILRNNGNGTEKKDNIVIAHPHSRQQQKRIY